MAAEVQLQALCSAHGNPGLTPLSLPLTPHLPGACRAAQQLTQKQDKKTIHSELNLRNPPLSQSVMRREFHFPCLYTSSLGCLGSEHLMGLWAFLFTAGNVTR